MEYDVKIHAHVPSVVSTLYSKDRGATWHIGEIIKGSEEGVVNPN